MLLKIEQCLYHFFFFAPEKKVNTPYSLHSVLQSCTIRSTISFLFVAVPEVLRALIFYYVHTKKNKHEPGIMITNKKPPPGLEPGTFSLLKKYSTN